ncbi:ankyrin repeat-containing domain protein [Cercophora scortea]|uniref:Ankyrin repeat-containing domain protein n=1 Tax=Cercophora scortea TaxID=314031 RepID=A0AAE0I2U6_9PEZI|nr:ankyrin repeat-containing domain protein [Cercophora scortea]
MANPFSVVTGIPTLVDGLRKVIALIEDASHAPQIVEEIRKDCANTLAIVLDIEQKIKNHQLAPFLPSDADDTDHDESSLDSGVGTGSLPLGRLLQDNISQFKMVIEDFLSKLAKLKPANGVDSVASRWAIVGKKGYLEKMNATIADRLATLQLVSLQHESNLQTQGIRGQTENMEKLVRLLSAGSQNSIYSNSRRYQRPVWTKSNSSHPPKLTDQRKFMRAVRDDNISVVGDLLQNAHPNFSCVEDGGLYPLQIAAQNGSIPMIQLLVVSGADVNCDSAPVSQKPLMLALANNHYNAALVLITRGRADVDLADEHHQTALHIAARKNFLPVVNALLQKGANPNACDKTQSTPLMEAVCREDREILPNDTTVLRALLEHEDPSTGQALVRQRSTRYTPMHHAARHGFTTDLRVLAEFGTKHDIQAPDEWGQSPLWFAVQGGHVDAVKVLLENGANTEQRPEHRNWKGPTALWAMATSSCENAIAGVRALLDAGAKPDAPETTTERFTLMHRAARQGDISMLKLLLEYNANPCSKDNEGIQPIHEAAINGHVHIIEHLLTKTDQRVDIDCPTKTEDQRDNTNRPGGTEDTPLILAAAHGCIGVVQYLLNPRTPKDGSPRPTGADLRHKNIHGNDALYMASSTGDIPCALLLLGAGADINMHNNKHNTPLHIAARMGHEDMVRLLLQMGADAGAKSKGGAGGIDVVGTPATVVRAFHERLGAERAERIAHIIEEWTEEDRGRIKWRASVISRIESDGS